VSSGAYGAANDGGAGESDVMACPEMPVSYHATGLGNATNVACMARAARALTEGNLFR
jgi:hypothetical protein